MEYKVLKEWEEHKIGEVINLSTKTFTDEMLADLISDGTLEPIFDEADYVPHTVTLEDLDGNPELAKNGVIVGDIIQIPKTKVSLEKPIEPVPSPVVEPEVISDEPRNRYNGQIVISDGFRHVNGNRFHHIKLEDGSEYDLGEIDYITKVKRSYPPIK